MGRMADRMKRYEGEKTIILILSEWIEIFGNIPEVGNNIHTETHEGTIKEVHKVDQKNDACVVTFGAYRKASPKQKKQRPHKEYVSQVHRILTQDTLDELNRQYNDYLQERQDQKELTTYN